MSQRTDRSEPDTAQDDWREIGNYLASRLPRRFLGWVCWAAGLVILGVLGWLGVRLVAAMSLVLVPGAIALLLVALLQPLNSGLRHLHVPRGLAALVSVFVLVAVLAGAAALAGFSLGSRITELIGQFQQSIGELQSKILHSPLPINQDLISRFEHRAQDYLQSLEKNLSTIIVDVTAMTVRVVTGLLLCAFLLIFLLYDGASIWRWLVSLLPEAASARVVDAGKASWAALAGFVHGTLIIAIVHGTVIGTTLYLLGVSAYLPLAMLVFLGSFVPVVGALVAGSVAVIFTLGTQGLVPAVILLAVLLAENELEAHVLQPFVVGRYVRLHPVAIVLTLTLGTVFAGIAGALLAVPLVGALRAAWGPLNGHESVVPVSEPSRLSRLWQRLRRAAERLRHRRRGGDPPRPE